MQVVIKWVLVPGSVVLHCPRLVVFPYHIVKGWGGLGSTPQRYQVAAAHLKRLACCTFQYSNKSGTVFVPLEHKWAMCACLHFARCASPQ